MVEHRSKLFGMSEVNECQTLCVGEHDIVGLNVAMSDALLSVKVEDGITYLPANVPLQPLRDVAPNSLFVVVGGAHQKS